MATQVSSTRLNATYAAAPKRTAQLAEIGYRPSYTPAAIAATLVFILYLITLAPSVAMWDTGEYMAAVKVLGIPHPPGNPFFVLLGHAFASLPIPVPYAERINIMAALASAISAGPWVLITQRILPRWVSAPGRWRAQSRRACGSSSPSVSSRDGFPTGGSGSSSRVWRR